MLVTQRVTEHLTVAYALPTAANITSQYIECVLRLRLYRTTGPFGTKVQNRLQADATLSAWKPAFMDVVLAQ